MAWSYDYNRLGEDLNRVRLEIGDTEEDRPLLQDEEIEQIISEQDTFNSQVAACCRLICSFFAGEPDRYRIENFTESLKEVYDRYDRLARRYEMLSGGAPWTGSVSSSEKEIAESDTDRVTPSFTRGMHDHP